MESLLQPVAFRALIRDVNVCTSCAYMAYAHALGPANGPLDAAVIFVAEAVGRRGGAVTGVPLTRDETGKRFQRFLDLAGIARTNAFVTNAVLCNPLDRAGRNRTPTGAEVARCRRFLDRTLELVAAPVVVALGRVALESLRAIEPHGALLGTRVAQPLQWCGRTLIPLYHPSRQSTLHRPQTLQEQDWRVLGALLRKMPPRRSLATMQS